MRIYSLAEQLELLKKINRIKIGNLPIYDYFSYKNYSLWNFYQLLIWRNIENFSKNQNFFEKTEEPSLNYQLFQFFLSLLIFTISVVSLGIFKLRNSKVIFQTLDKDTNQYGTDKKLELVYKFLIDQKIEFDQFFHTNLNGKTVINFFRRLKPVFYLTAVDLIFRFKPEFRKEFKKIKNENVNLKEFSEDEKKFIFWILEKYAASAELSVFKIRIFKKIINWLKPQIFLMSDDYVYGNEIHLAVEMLGIKTFSFQHGRFNKFLPFYINYEIPPEKCLAFRYYVVWNDFWKEKLMELSPMYRTRPSSVISGGKPFFEKKIKTAGLAADDVTTILIPYETIAPKDEIREYIKAILNCPKAHVLFKLRKDIDFGRQIEEAGLKEFKDNPKFSLVSNLTPEIMAKIDLIAGTYSTMLYEMVESGKPVGILKTSKSEAEDMVENGLAGWIDLKSEICSDMERIASTPEEILEQNSKKLRTVADFEETMKKIFNGND